jgi:hypothetical protein
MKKTESFTITINLKEEKQRIVAFIIGIQFQISEKYLRKEKNY